MTKIAPLPGYCLIEPIEDDERTSGGVYVPETSKDKPSKGKIVVTSDGNWQDGTWFGSPVKKGQTVIFKKWVNETISDSDKEYLFVRFEDLLGIYE